MIKMKNMLSLMKRNERIREQRTRMLRLTPIRGAQNMSVDRATGLITQTRVGKPFSIEWVMCDGKNFRTVQQPSKAMN